jgi:DNA-binding transcriptional LysR family regulator
MLNFTRIHSFVKSAETKDLKKTALDLHISQQGLVKQLSKLEEEINIKLFIKGEEPSEIHLTRDGEFVYQKLKHVVNEVEKSIYEIHKYKRRKKL